MDKNANRKIGQAGVCRVKSELLLRGWGVSEPEVDEGVDLIAYDSRNYAVRLQVKASTQFYEKTKSARFYTSRITPRATNKRAAYNPAEVDFLVCVCLPTNEFWVVPACDVKGRVKMHMTIGNDYHRQWVFLTTTKRKIGGDKYWSERSLTMELKRLEDYNARLLEKLRISEVQNEISTCKIQNVYTHLRLDYPSGAIGRILRYGTPIRPELWEQEYSFSKEVQQRFKNNKDQIEHLFSRFKPASGAQRDSATAGFYREVVEVSPAARLVPAHVSRRSELP